MSFGDRLHRLNFARALPGVDIDTDNVLRETNSDVVSTSTLDPPGDLVFDRSVAFPTSEPRWHRFFVAPNVRRLREDRGWSTADLAGRLGVGRHVVRDYERKRKGATQRQFLWSEIVSLCAVFDATIFDLILPEKGHRTVPSGWEHLPLVIPKVVTDKDQMRCAPTGKETTAALSWMS